MSRPTWLLLSPIFLLLFVVGPATTPVFAQADEDGAEASTAPSEAGEEAPVEEDAPAESDTTEMSEAGEESGESAESEEPAGESSEMIEPTEAESEDAPAEYEGDEEPTIQDRIEAVTRRTPNRISGLTLMGQRTGDPLDQEALDPLPRGTHGEAVPWYRRIEFHGEFGAIFRWRGTEGGANNNIAGYGIDRVEWQLRGWIGIYADFDEVEAGFMLGTASLANPATSADVTVDNSFTPDALFIRQAWARLNLAQGQIGLTLGRQPFPRRYMFRSWLTFDPDVALTGLHARFSLLRSPETARPGEANIHANLLAFVTDQAPTAGETYGFAMVMTLSADRLQATVGFWGIPLAQNQFANLTAADAELYAFEFSIEAKLAGLRAWGHMIWNVGSAGDNVGTMLGVQLGEREAVGDAGFDLAWYFQQFAAWPVNFTDTDAGNLFGGGMAGSSGVRFGATYVAHANLSLRLQAVIAHGVGNNIVAGDDNDIFSSLLAEFVVRF